MLKSQDVLIALKLVSIHLRSAKEKSGFLPPSAIVSGLAGWEIDPLELAIHETTESLADSQISTSWTYASLSKVMGISASECNEAVKRCLKSELLRLHWDEKQPIPNKKNIQEFLVYGLKYVFPVEEGKLERGIPTGFAAPPLRNMILSAGEHIFVWPDARGIDKGLGVTPLYKSVPFAVRYDSELYTLLALIDVIRFGKLREKKMAVNLIVEEIEKI